MRTPARAYSPTAYAREGKGSRLASTNCWLRLHLRGQDNTYALDLRIKRLHLTIWRRFHPCVAITFARPNCVEAGDAEYWAQWALWQYKAWGRFRWKRY